MRAHVRYELLEKEGSCYLGADGSILRRRVQLTQACRGTVDVGRERPRGKDWNEDLQERAERRAQERDRSPAHGRSRTQSPAHGEWDHDR